jgi:hypothetical protein
MNSRKLKTLLSFLIILFVGINTVFAQVWVDGYYRDDGTYVKGHQRTSPDGNPYNNYSYPGNYNPNTGEITPGNPDTYLRNYHDYSPNLSYDIDLPVSDLSDYNIEPRDLPDFDYEVNTNNYVRDNTYLKKEVLIVQSGLKRAGYNPGPVDGIWGPKTKSAIKDLQNDHSIYESGRLNERTTSALIDELKKLSSESNSSLLSNNSWLKGSWTGTGYETNYDSSWEMQISFSERGYFVKYYSPDCTGKWIIEDIKSDKVIFREKLTTGMNECANNGTVVLSKFSDNKIRFKFYYQYSDDLAAHAFLTKQ